MPELSKKLDRFTSLLLSQASAETEQTMEALKDRFSATKLFTVEERFGSWAAVMKTHFATGGEFDRLVRLGRK